uniref:Serpentine receptor class gamma n=1 Tax=Rhabditophanes sp. KR3021 TaxID=114890 RepID=A0AC35U9R2_9BILA
MDMDSNVLDVVAYPPTTLDYIQIGYQVPLVLINISFCIWMCTNLIRKVKDFDNPLFLLMLFNSFIGLVVFFEGLWAVRLPKWGFQPQWYLAMTLAPTLDIFYYSVELNLLCFGFTAVVFNRYSALNFPLFYVKIWKFKNVAIFLVCEVVFAHIFQIQNLFIGSQFMVSPLDGSLYSDYKSFDSQTFLISKEIATYTTLTVLNIVMTVSNIIKIKK